MNKRLMWNFEINTKIPLHIPEPVHEETLPERWESRFFWPEQTIIVLNGLHDDCLDLSRYEAKHRQDIYCILPEQDYNLKIRRNQLLYKPMVMKTGQAVAYGKKINVSEQQSPIKLPGTEQADSSALLAEINRSGKQVIVEKEAMLYRFETKPTLKLELARLWVANTIWFSVSIESRSKYLVDSITQQMFGDKESCDYVAFLKGFT